MVECGLVCGWKERKKRKESEGEGLDICVIGSWGEEKEEEEDEECRCGVLLWRVCDRTKRWKSFSASIEKSLCDFY